MSSNASERPPRDKTSRPFATLSHEKDQSIGPRDVVPTVPPEQLRKPYASLPPPAKRDDESPSTPEVIQDSGIRPMRSLSPAARANSGQCRKHQIQRNGKGVCLFCAKEAQADKGKGRTILWATLALVLGALVAVVIALDRL